MDKTADKKGKRPDRDVSCGRRGAAHAEKPGCINDNGYKNNRFDQHGKGFQYKKEKPDERFLGTHTVRVNGTRLSAPVKNETLVPPLLPPQFDAYTYRIPAAALPEGSIELEINEPVSGFQIAEFKIHREEDA